MFKNGDRVCVSDAYGPCEGQCGTVVHVPGCSGIGVLFDTWRGGHNKVPGAAGRNSWFVPPSCLELMPRPSSFEAAVLAYIKSELRNG